MSSKGKGNIIYEKANETELVDSINIKIDSKSESNTNIATRRSGSNTSIIKRNDGQITIERRSSNQDIILQAKRHLSNTAMPGIINILPERTPSQTKVLSAEETLEATGGKGAAGAYSEHMFPLDVLASKYETGINPNDVPNSIGLTTAKAKELLEKYGLNVLTPPPKLPQWLLFLLQFTNLLIVLLEITGIACLAIYAYQPTMGNRANLYIGVLLWFVIILTCYETYSQENKSDQLMEKFRAMVPTAATVIRDGNTVPVNATEIVVGDIIRLKSGDKIPADCRVIFNQSLKVDQSMITGESEAVESTVNAADPNALEARNIIFNGSLCVDGSCIAVAIRTGDATLIGTMVELTGDVGKNSSTLKKDIEYFVKFLTLFALFQSAVVFIVGILRGISPLQVFIQGFVVIMIGNVPQGLPATVTACLFIIADRMGKVNVFVKKLDIIETLGSCTCICTDKTGTLTQNLMSVANLWIVSSKFTTKESIVANLEESNADIKTSQLSYLIDVATLNSRVVLEKKTDDSPFVPNGDATELGLYRHMSKLIQDKYKVEIEQYRQENIKVHEVPFNSSNKWQMSIHKMKKLNNSELLLLKGAPDVLLSKCNRYLASDGTYKNIDQQFQELYTKEYEDFGGQGERVLGFAMKPLEKTIEEEERSDPKFKEHLKEGLVGLITLQDPPREEVPKAIKDCHTAGVKVVMVTGDHPLTAAAIARKIGLITRPTRDILAKERNISPKDVPQDDIDAVVVHGSEIPAMTEDDWKILVNKKEIVFARTSPEQKLIIVKEFTKAKHITAMTGDGVNDSPALKQAAIGVAMGLNGSDVAREAADIVLLDDNFASIVVGIKEGRLLFANLKKSIAYTLSHLVPEVVPVLLWTFVGIPQPMGALLALCIDLLTELVPATSLAYENPESLIMEIPPRNVKVDKLTNFTLLFYAYGLAGMVLTSACLFVYFRTFSHYGLSAKELFQNNNQYFPAASNTDIYYTKDGSGRVYDSGKQSHILAVVQGAWYLMIVCGQATHLFTCRTTTISIFEHGLFSNRISNIGIVVAICLGCFVVYTPGIQSVVQSLNPWSLDILGGTALTFTTLWVGSETRKYLSRKYPDNWWNKNVFGW